MNRYHVQHRCYKKQYEKRKMDAMPKRKQTFISNERRDAPDAVEMIFDKGRCESEQPFFMLSDHGGRSRLHVQLNSDSAHDPSAPAARL